MWPHQRPNVREPRATASSLTHTRHPAPGAQTLQQVGGLSAADAEGGLDVRPPPEGKARQELLVTLTPQVLLGLVA